MDALNEGDVTIFGLYSMIIFLQIESAIRSPLLKLDLSRYKPSCSLACPIVLPVSWSWITQ